MKLINIINNYCEVGATPRFYLKADTALLRNNDAFYIPDSLGRDAMLEGAAFLINDSEVAHIKLSDMRFSPDKIISHLSENMTLRIGDLIYLGSPQQFDIKAGDNLKLRIGDKTLLNFDVK